LCILIFILLDRKLEDKTFCREWDQAVDMLRRNSRWWASIISSPYGVKLESRIGYNFTCICQGWYASINTTICVITLLINR
jgi:hypothetical protein